MEKIKGIVFTVVFWTIASLAALCNTTEPICIGLSAPMTGRYAEGGKSFQNAVELAVEKINKAGGINGRQVKLIVGDSQGEPASFPGRRDVSRSVCPVAGGWRKRMCRLEHPSGQSRRSDVVI